MFRIVRDSGVTSASPPVAIPALRRRRRGRLRCRRRSGWRARPAARSSWRRIRMTPRAVISSPSRSGIVTSVPPGGGRRQDLDEAMSTLTPAVRTESRRDRSSTSCSASCWPSSSVSRAALDHLKRATTARSQTIPNTRTRLGLALRLHGDLDAADAQFRAALAKNPDHALARRSLGLVLRQKGDTAAAATELRRAATEDA